MAKIPCQESADPSQGAIVPESRDDGDSESEAFFRKYERKGKHDWGMFFREEKVGGKKKIG